jgi:archaeosortase B (VPXXXP-CTERM-specific)
LGHGKKSESKVNGSKGSGSFRKEFLFFLIVFFAIWLLSFLLTDRFPSFASGLVTIVARESSLCLDLLGYRFKLDGAAFLFYTAHGTKKLVVITECTGLYTTIIYFSIIGAYPARLRDKGLGLLIGIPSIHILNQARMVFISLVLYHRPGLFDLFHGYLWQVGFVIFMLLLVILWMGKIVKPQRIGASDDR